MKVDENTLKKLENFRGYLDNDRVTELFEVFAIKFAAGHWCAGDFVDRFATDGYNETVSSDILDQIPRVAAAKIQGIEFHNDIFLLENGKIDHDKITQVQGALEKNNVVATNMNVNLWGTPKWKLGAAANMNKGVREDAKALLFQAIDIAKEIGCASMNYWPGSDGWDYNFQVNYRTILDYFIDACAEVNKEAKQRGIKYGIEPKLHEPREGNIIVGTSEKAALVCKEVNDICGGSNMGICLDYGHIQMYAGEPADNLYTLQRFGVPILNFHVNNAKLHSNDEDRITGTGDIWRFIDFCYASISTNYGGWFGEDQFEYRTDPIQAMALSRELFGNCMKKALLIYVKRDELQEAQATGDAIKTLNIVKKIIYNG
ncbi:MAG: sugar phosphate isomerase/epimerase [Candidatus Helarchaeota archaeon]|nr:sugar phosphate isomerase/epimerase [Candidatus Helarchaeota archaeon]